MLKTPKNARNAKDIKTVNHSRRLVIMELRPSRQGHLQAFRALRPSKDPLFVYRNAQKQDIDTIMMSWRVTEKSNNSQSPGPTL